MRHIVMVPLLLSAITQPAGAHAFLDHAVPAVGAVVAAAPAALRLYFTQPLEPLFSGVALTAIDGAAVAGRAAIDPQDANVLVMPLPALSPGRYRVDWHVVSFDTHRTEGSFEFEVRR